jgi:hypothetical protein
MNKNLLDRIAVIAVVVLSIICLLRFYDPLVKLGRDLAPWATVVGVVMIYFGLVTIKSNNSTRRMELIRKIYDKFLEGELYDFYTKIRNKKDIDWQNDPIDERLLNESLTLFDEVYYLQTQGLLDDIKAWEYVASEIQYFSSNDRVWDYIINRIHECKDRGFPGKIMPFTGFPELVEKVPEEFRANPFPGVPDRYKNLFNP